MIDLLRVYHRLPYALRVLAASARGYYLRSWRYGRETEPLIRNALERESWTADRWKAYQEENLAEVLHRAATRVPYYREQWQARRRRGDKRSWEIRENWPVLTKEALRANPRAFIADDCDIRSMYHEHTSGTTGKPLSLWWSRRTVRMWYALCEARWRGWYGLSRKDRWAMLGGQLVTPFQQDAPPFWVWNAGLRQLYLSSYHLKPENVPAYLDAMRRHEIVYCVGYASSLHTLARIAMEMNLPAPQLRAVISNAEPLYRYQRDTIAQVFGCPVRDTYGMAEIVTAASECDGGTFHLWPEVGCTEILDDADAPAGLGRAGRLVGTSLLNADMPLIRYDSGDRARLASREARCPCARSLGILSHVEGRSDDVILTPDGRTIGRLDPVFKRDLAIREAQIIQVASDRLELRLVTAPGYSEHDERAVLQRLRQRVGEMDIVIQRVDRIPRTSAGKFRAVINELHARSLVPESGTRAEGLYAP